MQQLVVNLKTFHLIQSNAFRHLNLALILQKFVRQYLNKSLQKISHSTKQQHVNFTLGLLQRQGHSLIQKTWIKLLFIESLLNFGSPYVLSEQLISHVCLVCQKLNVTLNSKFNTQENKILNKFQLGFLKIKSIINISAGKGKIRQKNIQHEATFKQIVQQFLLNLRKKCQSFMFFKDIKDKYQIKKEIYCDGQNLQIFRQKVWKIINLIKNHSKIIKPYKIIEAMQPQLKSLMIASFVMLAHDNLKMYPYIGRLVEIDSDILKNKYQKIKELKHEKQFKRNKLSQLSHDFIFIELTQINQTIFYIFCGKKHQTEIKISVPKQFFLSITNKKLDQIHQILRQVKNSTQKRQRARSYRTLMTEMLDDSVSAAIDRSEKLLSGKSMFIDDNNSSTEVTPKMPKKKRMFQFVNNQQAQNKQEIKNKINIKNVYAYQQKIQQI